MFQKPKTAKRLYFDVIPRAVDEYLQFIAAFPNQDGKQKLDNPVWHIHSGHPPAAELPVTFALLLNLVSASNAHDKSVLWGFIQQIAPGATAEEHPLLDHLVGYAIRYYDDFVKPEKKFRAATAEETAALQALSDLLGTASANATAEDLQNLVYEAGKANGYTKETLRSWFQAIYEVLLGATQGPRFGSFIALYGVENTRRLIAEGLAGRLKTA
jgi:lysyl-tRNA synthetase class 1